MINKSKILGSIIFPLTIGTSLFTNRIHMNKEAMPAPIDSQKRVTLYPKEEIKKVNSVYDFQEIRGNIRKKIRKDKLEERLKNISLNSLNDYFKKNNWNMDNLRARLYYQINSDKNLDISLFWNNLPHQNNFRFFDQWKINLK